jgi:hypothetical protein
VYGRFVAETVGQPPWSSGTEPCPSLNGDHVDALRPAGASWMAGTAPCPRTNSTIRAQASACSSLQMPASSGLIRPSGETADASAITRPYPPVACEPRCTRCQSFGIPSTLLYWHIGDSQMRLRAVTPRRVMGSKSTLTRATTTEPGGLFLRGRPARTG